MLFVVAIQLSVVAASSFRLFKKEIPLRDPQQVNFVAGFATRKPCCEICSKEMKNEEFITLVSDEDGLTPEEAKSYGISDDDVAAEGMGGASVGGGDPAGGTPAEPNK